MKKLLFIMSLISVQTYGQVVDADQAVSFLSVFSSQIVHRPLNSAEVAQIRLTGSAAFAPIVEKWFLEPEFLNSSQIYIENLLRTSGVTETADYNLPGNLGRDIARKGRPYADLITANSCVDSTGRSIACDTNAPYVAGALTTKAYLTTAKGAYNISRAGKLTSKFLCTHYPIADLEEPKLKVEELIPQFATQSGAITFGNGNNCYSCHSQFGLHAQLFIKFDLNGNYISNATGVQNPAATDGFSTNGLATSHLKDPARSGLETTRILGRNVANLADAAQVITQSSRFLPCAVKSMMHHYLRLSSQTEASVKPDLYNDIAKEAKIKQASPSISHLLSAIITHPAVYGSFKKSGVRP